MVISDTRFQQDIQQVQHIPLIDTMLEVVCRVTGMGFAAVARVTDDRWLACAVRDEIAFGLQPGGELPVETTICNEIRQHHQPVLIDYVDNDGQFRDHPTPQKYGFQSYISIPIVLNNGEFFGTLCAIDPRPAKVTDIKVLGMFTLFAQLLAFHLEPGLKLAQSQSALGETQHDLLVEKEAMKRYEHLTYHSLREPLRKISLFSEMLADREQTTDLEAVWKTADRINLLTKQFARELTQLNP